MSYKSHGRFYNELLRIRQSLKDNRGNKTAISPGASFSFGNPVHLRRKPLQTVTKRENHERESSLSHELFLKIFQCSPLLMSITTYKDFCYLNINNLRAT